MSREIKFRGLRLDQSEFVFGDMLHGVGPKYRKLFILPVVVNLASIKDCHPLDGVEVLPESIGQFTGLKDKNGVEIYEGDIVMFLGELWEVIYFEMYASFMLRRGNDLANITTQEEVIGNIYQHPNLLKDGN